MDLLIRDGLVISPPPQLHVGHTSIAISDGFITDLGGASDLITRYGSPKATIDADGLVITPGLINAHTHTFQTLLRGLGDGLQFDAWQRTVTWPLYEIITAEDAYHLSLLGYVENVRSGVTTVVNFQAFPNSAEACHWTARALVESGLRGVLVKAFYERNARTRLLSPAGQIRRECEHLLRDLHSSNDGKTHIWFGPPVLTQASPDLLLDVHHLAKSHGSGIHTHIAESAQQAAASRSVLGNSEIGYLYELGILDEHLLAVHAVGVGERDIALLGQCGAHVVHCPVSNLYLGCGVAPVPRMAAAGINVCLGTDGPATNNNQNMLETMKFAALVQKGVAHDPGLLSPGEVLQMATVNAARALGFGDRFGIIAPGAAADLTLFDFQTPYTVPAHRPVSSLVHAATPTSVHTVIVAGRPVLDPSGLLTVDEQAVMESARITAERLLAKAGLRRFLPDGWPWI